jgi:hypothetical protein
MTKKVIKYRRCGEENAHLKQLCSHILEMLIHILSILMRDRTFNLEEARSQKFTTLLAKKNPLRAASALYNLVYMFLITQVTRAVDVFRRTRYTKISSNRKTN